MKKKVNFTASVIIINYNNSRYIKRCIQSLNSQTYKNFEIIFVDDQSKDNSIEIIKKIKKENSFKLFKTKSRTNHGGYNQINACKLGLKKSKGKIIFFLDSDDFFLKEKIETHIKYFSKENKISFLMDKPYIYYDKNNKYPMKIVKRNQSLIPWPQISSQSCIVAKKKYLEKIIKKIEIKKFPSVWLDFRLSLQAFLDFKKLIILDRNLTFYQKSPKSVSSSYKKFSLNWWKRRKEAHDFYLYLCKKNKVSSKISVDYIFTNLLNLFLK